MVIGKLIWKEGREHVWKMVAITALIVVPVIATRIMMGRDLAGFQGVACALLMTEALVFAGFVAAGTVAGERGRGSLERLLVLPVNPWVVFGIKSAWGALTLALPLSLGAVIMTACLGPAEDPSLRWLVWEFCAGAIWISLSFYMWTLAIAMGQRSEERAAMVGLLVFVGSLVWQGVGMSIAMDWKWQIIKVAGLCTLWPSPMGAWDIIVYFEQSGFSEGAAHAAIAGLVVTQVLTLASLWLVAGWRFGCMGTRVGRHVGAGAVEPAAKAIRVAGSSVKALLWKAWREVRWVAVGATTLGLAITVYLWLREPPTQGPMDRPLTAQVFLLMRGVGPFLACAAAVMIGTGSMCGDLDGHLVNYWRARPIGIRQWFWVKYGVGLLVVLVTLIVPAGLGAAEGAIAHSQGGFEGWGESGPRAWNGALALALFAVSAFGFAVFLGTTVRRVIYGAILASGVVVALALIPVFDFQDGSRSTLCIALATGQPHFAALAGLIGLGLAAVALPVMGWVAVERNWHLN